MLLEHLLENGGQTRAHQSLDRFDRIGQIFQFGGQLEFKNPPYDTVLKASREVDEFQGLLILSGK